MSRTLRDWILILALESKYEFFQPYVSSGILDEFGYKMRRRKPGLDDGALEMYKKQIRDSTWDVIRGFQVPLIPGYPDKDNLHVHAATDHGGIVHNRGEARACKYGELFEADCAAVAAAVAFDSECEKSWEKLLRPP